MHAGATPSGAGPSGKDFYMASGVPRLCEYSVTVGRPVATDTISLIKLVAYRVPPNISSPEEKKLNVINKKGLPGPLPKNSYNLHLVVRSECLG